jgi:hypothetical protein
MNQRAVINRLSSSDQFCITTMLAPPRCVVAMGSIMRNRPSDATS